MIFMCGYWIVVGLILLIMGYFMFDHIKKTMVEDKYHINILKNFNKLNISKSISKTGYGLIKLKIHNKRYNFLLDTGAGVNILNESALDEIVKDGYALLPPIEEIHVSGIDKGDQPVVALPSYSIMTYYNRQEFPADFVIKDITPTLTQLARNSGKKLHGIIGMPFFLQYKWIFDFDKNIIWIKKPEKKSTSSGEEKEIILNY